MSRRRQRKERIKATAEGVIDREGRRGAYEEARIMARRANNPADRRDWKRVASIIRRRTRGRGRNVAMAILGAVFLIVLTVTLYVSPERFHCWSCLFGQQEGWRDRAIGAVMRGPGQSWSDVILRIAAES